MNHFDERETMTQEQWQQSRESLERYFDGVEKRFYDNDLGKSITMNGQIKKALLKLERQGELVVWEMDDDRGLEMDEYISLIAKLLSHIQPSHPVVKPLKWEAMSNGSWWRAPNPFGGLPYEATDLEQKKNIENRYKNLVLAQLE